jgi:hypothetical protein
VPGSDDVAFSEDLRKLTVKAVRRDLVAVVQDPSTIPAAPSEDITDDACYAVLARTLIDVEYLVTYTPRPGQGKEDRRREFVDALFHAFTGGQSVEFSEEAFAAWYDAIVTRSVLPDDRDRWAQYSARLVKFLAEAQFFLTADGRVIGVAERVSGVRPRDEVCSFKGASEDSIFVVRWLDKETEGGEYVAGDYVLINGVYLHFTGEERKAHEKLVDELNQGKVETTKYTLA